MLRRDLGLQGEVAREVIVPRLMEQENAKTPVVVMSVVKVTMATMV